MGQIIDYVKSCNDTFAERSLSRVDSLVFSWLAYMRIPEDVPEACTSGGQAIGVFGSQTNVLGLVAPLYDPRSSEALLRACAQSPRFKDVVACHAADEWSREGEKQFSATTFLLGEGQGAYLGFRGTDDTLVGWKENLDMAYKAAIPAQTEACAYVNRVAAAVDGPLYLGGHSKGGNLAVYALNTCEEAVRNRIERCFAHDAPGFTPETVAALDWAGASDRVDRTIPEESIVGLLLDTRDVEPTIVKSTNPGLLQHAPFSWVVDGQDFACASAVSYDTYRTNKRIGAWLATLSAAEREQLVDVLYKLANATGEVTMSALVRGISDDSLSLMLQRLDNLPAAERTLFLEKMEDLVATVLLGPAPTNPTTPTERASDAADKIDDLTARFNDHASKIDKLLGL